MKVKYILLLVTICAVLFMGCSEQQSIQEQQVVEPDVVTTTPEPTATNSLTPTPVLTIAPTPTEALLESFETATTKKIDKYGMYEYDKFGLAGTMYDQECIAITYNNYEQMESLMSMAYGTWYDEDDNIMQIDSETIDGVPYVIRTMYKNCDDDGETVMFYYSYANDLETIYGLGYGVNVIETLYGDKEIFNLYGLPVEGVPAPVYWYCSVDYSTRLMYYAAEEEYYNAQNAQSHEKNKSQAYSAAKEIFKKNYIDKNYSLAKQIYVSTKYQDEGSIGFSYDPNMDTYNIRFEVAVSDNFGVTWNNFVVQVQFYNAGNGRYDVSMFNIY